MIHRNQKLEEDIKRRNEWVEELFERNGFPVRLIGERNSPAIIYDERVCLSAFVHNFDLIFTDVPVHGNRVKTIRLNDRKKVSKEEIQALISHCCHRAIFMVKMKAVDLFLSGYNFLGQKGNRDERYPVFARYNCKIYFHKDYAEGIVNDHKSYNLEVHNPDVGDLKVECKNINEVHA